MKDNIDLKTGYVVPDGYFQDFALKMSDMVSHKVVAKPRRNIRWILFSAVSSSVAAVIILLVGMIHYSKYNDPIMKMSKLSQDEIIINYFGATEAEVINYYYLSGVENNSETALSNDTIDSYISDMGNLNLFALLDNN